MQVSKLIVALTVAAGFVSSSFAQANTALTTPAVPTAKVTIPTPAVVEKKVETPKAVETKPAEHHGKHKGHSKKEHKAAAPAAVTK